MTKQELAHIARLMYDLQEYGHGRDHSDKRVCADCPIQELCMKNISACNWHITKADIERLEADAD